jgi:hypothetical protein
MLNQLSEGAVLAGKLVMPSGAALVVKKLEINAAPTGAEQDTGWDLPAKAIVLDVWVDVRVAEATGLTKTLDVGLLSSESGGDTDGFLASVSVASTGLKKGTLASTGQTRGALLYADESGTGGLVPEPHVVGTARSVVYDADSNDWVEFRGDIYILYLELGITK